MPITIGQQLGSYEITALLGEGGMGIVFARRITKLQREVPLKLLSDHFADDADRLLIQMEANLGNPSKPRLASPVRRPNTQL
jgi:hypothetical protein